jgi:3D (Asp-Asp-Asp) domain-containing protein
VAVLVVLQLLAASGAGAQSPQERARQLRSENDALAGRAEAAWLSSETLSTRLQQTRAALVRFRARTQAISAQRAEAAQSLRLARRTLRASQQQLAQRLRVMYEQSGDTDPMAVLVGATSVDEALNRIESLHRLAHQDHEVIAQAKAAKARLIAATQRLAAEEARARQTEAATAATVAALDAAREEQAAAYASLKARQQTNSGRISSLEAQARELASVTASPTQAPSLGGRTLTVLATGYALPGTTSTGVPVGYGIVAVDPNTIPLGTHMTVPGYGEGVAADTGGAVAGAHIDLWFPTRAEALAWGSRTVTVTLH